MGPTLIFDKSAIHSFAEREAQWLSNLYSINRIPTLFMEILADLKKYSANHSLSRDELQKLANKFSLLSTYQNIHHSEIWHHSLLGKPVPMDGRVLIGGARQINSKNQQSSLLIEESPEDKAMRRWQRGQFNNFEEGLADKWRSAIKEIDLQSLRNIFRKKIK
ncbi:MAG: hypothetical protein VYB54_04025 [Pseudomonadota bacterium]|nr:hypothetical protein [Pseudomonadota bacterium]